MAEIELFSLRMW